MAVSNGRKIVPLLLDETPLPSALEDIHAIYSTKDICSDAPEVAKPQGPVRTVDFAPALNARLPEPARPRFDDRVGEIAGSHMFPAFREALEHCGENRALAITAGIGLGGLAWAVAAGFSSFDTGGPDVT